MCQPLTLFGPPDPPAPTVPEPAENVSADRRRTLRQRAAIDAGIHPLALLFPAVRINPDPALRCGNCVHRQTIRHHDRAYPKCTVGNPGPGRGRGRMSHGSATDVRAWWPACQQHEPEADQ